MEDYPGQIRAKSQNSQPEELAVKTARRDSAAFEALYERYKDYVGKTGLQVLHRREDEEDISQQVWTRFFLKLRQSLPGGKFTTWLHSVTKHAAIDHFRRMGKSREVSLEAVAGGGRRQNIRTGRLVCIPIQSLEMDFLIKHIHKEFNNVLESLSKKNENRAISFQLYYFYGKSVKEIASEINISEVN